MSYSLDDLRQEVVFCDMTTQGGFTYFIKNKPVCLGVLTDGINYCSRYAGNTTDHSGTGKCGWHGGMGGRLVKTGRYSKVGSDRFRKDYQDYLQDGRLLDLKPELALMRTFLTDLVEKYEEKSEVDLEMLGMIRSLWNDVSSTVGRIEKITSEKTLTAASARLLMARAITTMRKLLSEWYENEEVIDERMEQFLLAWKTEAEGDLFE